MMFACDRSLDLLFNEVAEPIKQSVTQSRNSIVRAARQRLEHSACKVIDIHVLAASQLRDRHPKRGLATLQRFPAAMEQNATGHRLAGYAYLMQRSVTTARAHLDAAVRLDPRLHDCWTLLGKIAERQHHAEQAEAYYQRAMFFDDSTHEAALALARLYSKQNRLNRAIATIRCSLARDRRSAVLNSTHANLLIRRAGVLRRKRKSDLEQSVLQKAVACFQTAIAASPNSRNYSALGRLQQRLGRFDEAASAFNKAVQLNEECPTAITLLANNSVESGNIDDALTMYRRAIQLAPEFAPAHFRFSRAQRFKGEESTLQYVDRLAELVSNSERSPRQQIQLNFALAKVLDDIGQHDRAWQHYDRANRLKTGHSDSLKRHNPERCGRIPLRDTVDAAVEFFTPEFFASHTSVGNPSTTPVFIAGMPRSGTTLTEQILSSHPDVLGAGELKEIERIRQRIAGPSDRISESSCQYPQNLAAVGPELRELADKHVSLLDGMRGSERFVIDKMPTNFIHLGLIAVLFPNATVIHCRRDPMDVLVSCYCQNLSPPFCDLEALALYHQQYRRLMAHWQEVLPMPIHSVDYEAMVANSEIESRRLLQCCGLKWDQRCLNFHANDRAVHTPSKWQVRQPMYKTSVNKWKRFESHLGPIVDLVSQDYQPDSSGRCESRSASTSEFHNNVA